MKFHRTIGNVGIRLDTDRLDRNLREAQKKLNMQVAEDCEPYIPFSQGDLRESLNYPEGIYGGIIEWNTPYAHYQYEGILYLAENGSSWAHEYERKYPTDTFLIQHAPGTRSHWFECAKEENMDEWIKLVEKTIGRGL